MEGKAVFFFKHDEIGNHARPVYNTKETDQGIDQLLIGSHLRRLVIAKKVFSDPNMVSVVLAVEAIRPVIETDFALEKNLVRDTILTIFLIDSTIS